MCRRGFSSLRQTAFAPSRRPSPRPEPVLEPLRALPGSVLSPSGSPHRMRGTGSRKSGGHSPHSSAGSGPSSIFYGESTEFCAEKVEGASGALSLGGPRGAGLFQGARGLASPRGPARGAAAREGPSSPWRCRRAQRLSDRWPGCQSPAPPLALTRPRLDPEGTGGCCRRPPGGPGRGPDPAPAALSNLGRYCAVPRTSAIGVVPWGLPGRRISESGEEQCMAQFGQPAHSFHSFSQLRSLNI